MSMLVYAISRDDALAPAAAELHEVCAAGLRALVEPVAEPLSADLEELVHYEETVETVMRRHTILPMRFGSVVDDEGEVRDLLKARAREFAHALAQLDGAVEFGVQASVVPDSVPATVTGPATAGGSAAAGPGRSYMHARLAEQHRRRELQSWLDAALDGVVRLRAYRVSAVCAPGSLSAAYLVDRACEQEFLARIEELAATADHTLSWSGPWPPYTFVEELEA
jgi:hypothetical protein